jgi:hypothetical protein
VAPSPALCSEKKGPLHWGDLTADGPQKSCHLASNGGDHHRQLLAGSAEPTIPGTQPQLCFPSDIAHRLRQAFDAGAQCFADPGGITICPSGFNQGPSSASIAPKGQPLAFRRQRLMPRQRRLGDWLFLEEDKYRAGWLVSIFAVMTIRSAAAVTFAASSSNLPCNGIAFIIRPPRILMINSSPLGPCAIWFTTAPTSDTSFSNCSTFDMGRSSPIIGRHDRVSTSGHHFRRVKAVVLSVRLKTKIRVVATSDDALCDHIVDPMLVFLVSGTAVFSVFDHSHLLGRAVMVSEQLPQLVQRASRGGSTLVTNR